MEKLGSKKSDVIKKADQKHHTTDKNPGEKTGSARYHFFQKVLLTRDQNVTWNNLLYLVNIGI